MPVPESIKRRREARNNGGSQAESVVIASQLLSVRGHQVRMGDSVAAETTPGERPGAITVEQQGLDHQIVRSDSHAVHRTTRLIRP